MTRGVGGIPHNLPPNLYKLLEQIKEKSEIGARERGDPMQSYVTLGELVALDLARIVRIAPGGGVVVQPPGPPDLTVPPVPTGFVVTNGFSHVFTEWASPYDAYSNHARTRIYRAASDNLADAVEIGQSTGFAFADLSVATGTVYYYWIRWESTSGVLGPVNDTAGTPGQRSDDPAEILALLVGEITETHLYAALNDRINLIDAPDTGLIDLLEAETAERLAAILALLDQLEDAEGRILAAETDITALGVEVVDLETGIAAQGTAVSLLTTRVTTAEGAITSQGTALTVLEASLEDAEDAISGNASAVSALDARVTITETSITSQSSSIVALGNSIDDLEGDVSGNTSAISSLLTGLTAAEGTISAHSSQLTSLSAEVDDAAAAAAAAASAATALDARVDITESTISSHSTQLTALSADITAAESDIAANATAITSLDSRVDATESSITSISSSITFLTSSVEDVETGLAATGTAVTALESRVDQTEDDIEAQATATTQVNARLDDFGGSGVTVEQKLFAAANDVEGLLGSYTLKIDANGHVAGFGLSIETNNAGQSTSYFMVNANRFAIVSSTLAKRVTGQSVTSGILTATTDGAHGLVAENEVMFTGMEEEEWKSETLEVIDAPTSTTFRVAVPSGYTTPMTAAIKGNFRPLSSLTRSGTVATAVFPSGHNIVVGGSIDITNADQPEWNSKFVATGVDGNNVTFTVTTEFTTPATASVKVARVTIPFVVADNRVVMDGAFIKNATINTAQVGTISVEKITGINATFIQANINEIDAFEIDVINLTAENINGDLQRINTISATSGLPGFTAHRVLEYFLLEPSIGSNGHRLAINLQGYMTRSGSPGTVDTDGYISLYVKAIPYTLSGASSIALTHIAGPAFLEDEESPLGTVYDEVLRFKTGDDVGTSVYPVHPDYILDIQPGDVLVRDLNGARWFVKSVSHEYIGTDVYAYVAGHAHDGAGFWTAAGSLAYTRYRPPATTFGTMKIPTNGALYVPYTLLAATSTKFSTLTLLEVWALIEDPDGDPVGTALDYNHYNNTSMTGFIYGLR